jgi:cell division protein FtsL
MSNLARKYRQMEQQDTRPVQKRSSMRAGITKGEKLIYIIAVAIICLLSIKIIANQSSIYSMNKEIQIVQSRIDEQEQITDDLQARVDELTDYQHLLALAKELGLKIDENHVKSVRKP